MSKTIHGIVVVTALAALTGCNLPLRSGGANEARGPIHEKAAVIAESGGFAAEGVGRAKSIAGAVDRARAQVKAEIVRVMESTVNTLARDFAAEIGGKKNSEYDALFDSVLKQLKEEVAPQLALVGMEYETRDGVTTAHALIVLDPRIVVSALETAPCNASLRARFLASRTFRAFDEKAKADSVRKGR